MNTTSRGYPAGAVRVSDADRDAALAELSEHFQAGRLTSPEFDERTGKALSARTGMDLAELTTDLPAPPDASAVAVSQAGAGPGRHGISTGTAIGLAAIGSVLAVATILGHARGGMFPWWLIPLGFIVFRRLTRGGRRTR